MFEGMFKKTYIKPDKKPDKKQRSQKVKKIVKKIPQVPEGLFQKCDACRHTIYSEDVIENDYICPKCGKYFRIPPRTRISMVLDQDSFIEWDVGLETSDPLDFPDYKKKIACLQEVTNLEEAVITGEGSIGGERVAIAVMGTEFMMGSMGEVVGEKITRAIERATFHQIPIIIFCCSGGARMQEGMISLMQMAKTSAALKRHDEEGLFYISILTDPTTGGVTASFAMLGDIILAEPKALIGFAGPRVIEQTIGQKLPEGFQQAEFLLEHGFVDKIVERKNLRYTLTVLLNAHL